MRLLFTFAGGGSGHLDPLLPLARAARGAGHEVAFAARPLMVPQVQALGFAAFAAGSDSGLAPGCGAPWPLVHPEREILMVGPGFGRRIARERAPELLALCATWRPDLLVCEELDFGAMVVAEKLRLPHATVLVIASGAQVRPANVAGPLGEVRAAYGLPPDPDLALPGRYLVLSPFPPRFRDPAFPLPATARAFRPDTPGGEGDAPEGPDTRADTPTVYFTLGTVFNLESGDLFGRVITGLRDLPVNLIVTVGRHLDPAELGPQPPNVRIARYIPQAELLPQCHAVVSHGGSGSVLGALTHGLPLALIPLGADQPLNAARCESLGVGKAFDALALTPADIRAGVSDILTKPSYRQAALQLRDEIRRLPGPEHALGLMEHLARDKQPILAD